MIAIAIFGAGEIAAKGIIPVVGGLPLRIDDCDVRHGGDVDRTMGMLRPSAVVFTAGISRPISLLSGDRYDSEREILTNLVGAFNVAHAAVKCNVETLVFIASLAGLYGKPEHAGYSASKAGVISLVQSLAMEGHNAYAISPGRVNTAMRERDYPGEDPRTRLDPLVIGGIIKDIFDGRYTPGDNVIIRMRGFEQLPIEVHRGDGWAEKLWVGKPKTC